jgi:hypothetical protein
MCGSRLGQGFAGATSSLGRRSFSEDGKPAYDENILHINKSIRCGISGMSAGGIG